MSLLDALLFDPYRDRAEFWITNRGPQAGRGSGTQADPFNAATISTDTISVTGITRVDTTATVVTDQNHGFQTGDMVTISGVIPAVIPVSETAPDTDFYYLGTFAITRLTNTSFS